MCSRYDVGFLIIPINPITDFKKRFAVSILFCPSVAWASRSPDIAAHGKRTSFCVSEKNGLATLPVSTRRCRCVQFYFRRCPTVCRLHSTTTAVVRHHHCHRRPNGGQPPSKCSWRPTRRPPPTMQSRDGQLNILIQVKKIIDLFADVAMHYVNICHLRVLSDPIPCCYPLTTELSCKA